VLGDEGVVIHEEYEGAVGAPRSLRGGKRKADRSWVAS